MVNAVAGGQAPSSAQAAENEPTGFHVANPKVLVLSIGNR